MNWSYRTKNKPKKAAVILWNQSLLRSGMFHWMTSGYTLFCCFINAAAPSWWHRMCSIATSWLRYDGDISDWMGCRLNLLPDWSVTLSNDIGEKVGGVGNIKLATSQSCMILHPAAPPKPGGAAFKCRVILPEAFQMDCGCSPPRKYLKLFSNLGFMQLWGKISYEL